MVALGQCLHQCWNVVGWAFRDGLQWNFDQNQHIFIWEDAFENVVGGGGGGGGGGGRRPFCLGHNVLILV